MTCRAPPGKHENKVIINLYGSSMDNPEIRHRAARHQWSVSNALVRFSSPGIWESLNCFKGPQEPGPDLLNPLHDFFAGMFLLSFFVSIFLNFNNKKHPKGESKSTQNR